MNMENPLQNPDRIQIKLWILINIILIVVNF